ncbi:MAG: Maf family protein [Defluviitaleaceae bacterium]|nr:Maf family protein [Defluviitaleaceae bacterium]
MKTIILASGSPRRQQLLDQAGIPHQVLVSGADETVTGQPAQQVKTLALRKARAVLPLLDASQNNAIIIAADTLVFIGDEVLSKPESPQDAFDMLKKLQGITHTVYTGVALIDTATGHSNVFAEATLVTFRPLADDEIWAYIATGEPFDKAGAYGIQEKGATLVERINGDFYTVMGLPISKVCTTLGGMGYDYWHRG